MFYTAVLVACLASTQASAQAECHTHEMLIQAGANPVSAYIEAQNRAVQWLEQHPGLAQHSLTIHPGRSA